jgi:hypothetical protein
MTGLTFDRLGTSTTPRPQAVQLIDNKRRSFRKYDGFYVICFNTLIPLLNDFRVGSHRYVQKLGLYDWR